MIHREQPTAGRTVLWVREESDIFASRRIIRELACDAGLAPRRVEALALAATEIARNILAHACKGELVVGRAEREGRRGIAVTAYDRGPGIPNVPQAMVDGYSTNASLGLGLASAQRLVDEFEIRSQVGEGTTVTIRMWAGPETGR